ncbi:MAG: hypothetical protein HF314_05960 [Ignavibacteria bacterium]|jgi:hypothetical protein|nr:hypothetical protein [Ignavibacteria bacterium]MCU7502597.1 hypothetical protein [Ignavibacteria bacterium]MCU7515200.1 hypothetical protein [Ignavibacteria bacterium]
MKKRFFRSLEGLLENKRVVIPFLSLLAASAILVWTTAFAPKNRKSTEDSGNEGSLKEGEGAPEGAFLPENMTSRKIKPEGLSSAGEHLQCKAITKKGTRCQHMADESGYCRQHRALFENAPIESPPQL